jgi:hypothetical protein
MLDTKWTQKIPKCFVAGFSRLGAPARFVPAMREKNTSSCRIKPCAGDVLSSSFTPVYASQNLPAYGLRTFVVVRLAFAFTLFAGATRLRGGSLEDAPHELAMKVCTDGYKQAVSVRWQESADSSGYWSDARKKSFLDQISACGIEPTENPDAPIMRVSAEVTPARVLLVAESSDAGNGRQIRMVEVPRILPLNPRENSFAPHLSGELLWQQERPIWSAMEWQDEASQERLLFLIAERTFVRLRYENGSWQVIDSAELPPVRKHTRLPDANFAYAWTGRPFEFLFDGKICGFTPTGPLSFSCAAETVVRKPLQLSSKCEPLPRYLIAGNRDFSQPDQILLGGQARDTAAAVPKEGDSSAVDVPGPVLAMTLGETGTAAFAVVRNLSTGDYEVYRITAVCGD